MELGREASGWRVSNTSRVSNHADNQLYAPERVWKLEKGERLWELAHTDAISFCNAAGLFRLPLMMTSTSGGGRPVSKSTKMAWIFEI